MFLPKFHIFNGLDFLEKSQILSKKTDNMPKKKFFHIFFCCLSSRVLNFFVKTKFHIYNGLDFPEKNNFRQKTDHTRQKKLYIYIFYIFTSNRFFFVFTKISYFQVFPKIANFWQKKLTTGRKNQSFISHSVAHSNVETELFCF